MEKQFPTGEAVFSHDFVVTPESCDECAGLSPLGVFTMLQSIATQHAELLGVGAAFARRFGSMQLEPCPWLTDARESPATALEFYRLYADVLAQLRGENASRLSRLLNPPRSAPPVAQRRRR